MVEHELQNGINAQQDIMRCKQIVAFVFSQNWRKVVRYRQQLADISPASISFRPLRADSSGVSAEDLQRWERMYEGGRQRSMDDPSFPDKVDGSMAMENQFQTPIRVISFDLDNTLWSTGATIDRANDALALFLNERKVTQTKRVEKVMGDLFSSNKARYCPTDTENIKGPVLLTLLRKDAIQMVLELDNGYSKEDAITLAEDAFQVWVQARHSAISSHMVEEAIETLQSISSIASSEGIRVKIGAITDGNSNPEFVECLSGFFDFVVNAEQVGVPKPDKRIYVHAARQVLSDSDFHDLYGSDESSDGDALTWSDSTIEDMIGPWWVHVGDDFVKDIVAAKSLNMRSIWVKELIQGRVQKIQTASLQSTSSAKNRSLDDLVKEISQMEVLEMEVGASDYLAQSLQSEFADAVIDRFADLRQIIADWHEGAMGVGSASTETDRSFLSSDTHAPFETQQQPAAAVEETRQPGEII